MKIIEFIKKIATSMTPMLVAFLSGLLILQTLFVEQKFYELNKEIEYLMDSSHILQKEVEDLRAEIQKIIEED